MRTLFLLCVCLLGLGCQSQPLTPQQTQDITVTVTGVAVLYVVLDGVSAPAGADGLVGPKPVPHRMTTSPGAAGTVVSPANVPFLTASEKSWRVATA